MNETFSGDKTCISCGRALVARNLSRGQFEEWEREAQCSFCKESGVPVPSHTSSNDPTTILRALVEQIKRGNLVDDHGHRFEMNDAYLEAVKFLDRT